MPNIKSAKKRVAVTEKKNTQNKMIKSAVKTAVKKYNALLAAGDLAGAEKLLPETVSVIDSAVSKGILHKNNAANKKSALAKNLNSAKAAAEKAAAEKAVAHAFLNFYERAEGGRAHSSSSRMASKLSAR